ncbi:MAG TPA: lactate utilization protein [archaeon]|nr:lactate utilization protein [archaeon]
MVNMSWTNLAEESIVEKTAEALMQRGIEVFIVGSGEEAKKKVLELIPAGAEVMTQQSMTLNTIGLAKEIDEGGKYVSIRKKIVSTDDAEKRHELRRASATAEYSVGSVHAVTEEGQVVAASNSGSQLAPYVSGAAHVIWVVGTQKIVKTLDEAFRRIEEHSLPLESERLMKIHGVKSNISKLLVVNRETVPGRIKLIFVKEKLGF